MPDNPSTVPPHRDVEGVPHLADRSPLDDPGAWATLWRQARRRRGWSYLRLAAAAEVTEQTVIRACTTGRCSAHTAQRLSRALGLMLILPAPRHTTTAEAQHG